jgi:phosphoribosylformimino-5-aminoimidazole carboxamide ribotide isomerase
LILNADFMLIIPAIDIRGGKCVRLFQGIYGKETIYGENPRAMAKRWIAEGATFLHLVDLDGARQGTPANREEILAIVEGSSVPVEVGGGIRSLETIDDYLSRGVQRVILGTAAYADPHFLQEACAKWPKRIAVDIAARNGQATISGWTEETKIPAIELAKKCEALDAAIIIYTDVLRDGTQRGINIQATRELARALQIPVIASGGVSVIEDIEALKPLEEEGVVGVIIGRALYEGTLKLSEAIARTGGKRG